MVHIVILVRIQQIGKAQNANHHFDVNNTCPTDLNSNIEKEKTGVTTNG